MIDINELRKLAQAATPGPWINYGRQPNASGAPHSAIATKTLLARVYSEAYGDFRQETANADLIAAANPTAISELLDRLEAAEAEALEQARLNGMGSEREAALMAKLEAAERDRATFITEIGNLCAKVEALREELSKQQALSQAAQQLAEVAQRRADALSGVQNVPKEAIAKILVEVMDIAVSNGANSRSMPDEYVEVAKWLCGIHAQPAQRQQSGAKGE